ncbi:unconventional myosin-IXa isoform X2 [Protopterus annectens]|uniref:unconventional myosin-IXa isoform X2 n=1 Tax=Protopterus annectens TaxID=7888 RepID=UPI001CFAA8C1|nr:unconventional myosin-IXa isoform X2 [Protopterus annectens]
MRAHDVGGRRRFEDNEFTLRIYPGSIAEGTIYCPVAARKSTTAAEVIDSVIVKLQLDKIKCYVLAEVKEFGGEEWILNPTDCPVQRMMLWPRMALENRFSGEDYRFLLREKNLDGSIHYGNLQSWLKVTEERRRMMERGFLPQPQQKDYDDLCSLPDLNEKTLLENLRNRFKQEKIYTYVGSILIVINPFKFLPIYNPKYVKMYDNHQLGKLEPHIYAVADVAYHAMLHAKKDQCIVISGESGSGKTQSTNFLIHHLTALSQKGFASGVEQIILGAGPVLEAFGNAKTAHNNNSSRFGKFIQVNYHETGTVRGAYVEKYLLEKSRLVYQEHNERNYHVFYYLLAGTSEEERTAFHLKKPEEYHYLNQMTKKVLRQNWDDYYYDSELDCFTVEGEDLKHDFERLQLAMEMVGFLPTTCKQIFSLLSAILHLGNIQYKKKTYRDDSIDICNPEVLPVVSELLEVKQEMLFEALTTRKTVTVGERLIVPYKKEEAVTVRDSMARSLYSALFDWIVFRINHALLNNRDLEDNTKILSIGVLDIFGFEDYESNSFEQFCINFANERLQHYFNQHIFKLEQEEYRTEGISWHNIDYIDNTSCINLISKKPTGLFHLLDEECNFPQATNQTLLDKIKRHHEGQSYIEFPAVLEPAFIIRHYAGKVKYGVKDFRAKNTDHMRPDIVALLKSSKNAFICGLIGIDPVAVFRWCVLRAFFRAVVAFREAGKRFAEKKTGNEDAVPSAVLKSMDSFSFLHHPVHQRSLEILQRCKEEKYSIARKSPRTPLSDLQGTNTINEKSQRNNYDVSWNGRTSLRQSRLSTNNSILDDDGIFINTSSSKLLERAHGILMRNKNYKPKPLLPKHLLDVKSLKHLAKLTLHDRITKSLLHLHKKKKPPSISAQFQTSLNKLMETLGQAEPYFVKCIRSNAEKMPLRFDDKLVLRQLRYTGMLETVRIRQSGYPVKYTFQDFVKHFHVLLPRGTNPSQQNILEFLRAVNLNSSSYQVGLTMVFMKEQERQQLQDLLHREVLRRIILLQHWFRALLDRRYFLNMKQAAVIIQSAWKDYKDKQKAEFEDLSTLHNAAVIIQSSWRKYREEKKFLQMRSAAICVQRCWQRYCRRRHYAAVCIQSAWRGFRVKSAYNSQRRTIVLLQAMCRGHIARLRFRSLKEQRLKERQLANGLRFESRDVFNTENTLLIKGSDPSKWEDRTFKDREKALWERRSEKDYSKLNTTGLDSDQTLSNLHEGIIEPNNLEMHQQDVVVRERHKVVDDPDQKKVVRAKRESRRMRELEQAIFSLELLKVRASGLSPSEENPWPMELLDGCNSPHGTPDSQSSRESFEMLNCDEDQLENDALETQVSLNEHLNPSAGSPKCTFSGTTDGIPLSEKKSLDHISISTSLTPGIDFIPGILPTFYIPPPESLSVSSNKAVDTASLGSNVSEDQEICKELKKETWPEHREDSLLGFKHKTDQPKAPFSENIWLRMEEGPASTLLDENKLSMLERLEKLNSQKEERQKQQQQQNEREMMEQIRQQKEILEKQRRMFEQHEREIFEKRKEEALQKIEKSRQNDLAQGPVLKPQSRQDQRPQSLLILQPEVKGDTHNPSDVSPSDIAIKMISVPDSEYSRDSVSVSTGLKGRPVTMYADRMAGQPWHLQDPGRIDGWSPKLTFDSSATTSPRLERLKQSRVPVPIPDTSANERTSAFFFSPKENKTALNKYAQDTGNQEGPWVLQKDGPPKKSFRISASIAGEVAGQTQKKRARMARTRSDFLTRVCYIDGEEDTEEDDFEDIIEIPLSPDQPSLPNLDPETLLKFGMSEGSKKLHKTMSQGDIVKLEAGMKNPIIDGRPPKGKMKFWGKTRPGEKKVEKLATQSEVLELSTDQEGSGLDTAFNYQNIEGHHPTPPRSPDLASDRGREFKENKEPSPKVKRKRSVKISNVTLDSTQWQNDSLQIITSANDLKCMDEFLLKKITDLDTEDSKKDTLVDVVFKKALKEFRLNIFNIYSTALTMDDGKSIRYKDLYALFEQILEKTMRLEQRDWSESPVKVWVNTFKVFLDEFMTECKPLESNVGKVPKNERKKRRKKEADIVEEHNGHIFKSTQYSIPNYCEYCSSIIWIMDKASVCKLCKYACHKKCCLKTTNKCSKKYDLEISPRHFGVDVSLLTNEEKTVPVVAEKLINYIEMHGLYTEGIYRKSGSTNKSKELRQGLDTDLDRVNLDDYNIHVIASVFKQWLRELPNPLMTFEFYSEFLRVMGLQDRKDMVLGVYSIINQLTRAHLSTLERLIFHLVRIALEEETNRMSANALAIVFAPCILRCPDTTDPLESVQDISKTTACVELIVIEQMNKYKARLKDISSLEFAENKAKNRLSLIRRSMKPVLIAVRFMSITRSSISGKGRLRRLNYPSVSSPGIQRNPSMSDVAEELVSGDESMEIDLTEQQQAAMQQEERVLTEQIESLQKEKEELTYEMIALEPRASDDETLESEASIGTADSSENLNLDSEGTDRTERSLALSFARHGKMTPTSKARRQLKKQSDSVDSAESGRYSPPTSSASCIPQRARRRFHFRSKSPSPAPSVTTVSSTEYSEVDGPLRQTRGQDDSPQYTSRGTFNPEKGKQKLKAVKVSPQKPKECPEGGVGKKKNNESDCRSSQQVVLLGNNEFMV